jgi:hypothetical protein
MPVAHFGLQPAKLILRTNRRSSVKPSRHGAGDGSLASGTKPGPGAPDQLELSHLVVLDAKPITAAVRVA